MKILRFTRCKTALHPFPIWLLGCNKSLERFSSTRSRAGIGIQAELRLLCP